MRIFTKEKYVNSPALVKEMYMARSFDEPLRTEYCRLAQKYMHAIESDKYPESFLYRKAMTDVANAAEAAAALQAKMEVPVRHEQTADLNNLSCASSCKLYKYWGSARIAFGPTVQLTGSSSKSRLKLGLTLSSDGFNTEQEGGIAFSFTTNKGRLETNVESRISRNDVEYALTGQINGPNNLNAGVEFRNNSFKHLLAPSTFVNGRGVLGYRQKTDKVETNIRFSVLPFDKIKNFVGSDQTGLAARTNHVAMMSPPPYVPPRLEVSEYLLGTVAFLGVVTEIYNFIKRCNYSDPNPRKVELLGNHDGADGDT